MIIFNANAILLALLGGVCGGVGYGITRSEEIALIVGFVAVAWADFYMRTREGMDARSLFGPNTGGHVWFIPAWVIVTGLMLITVIKGIVG